MIDELAPGGQEDGDGVVVEAQVAVVVGRDEARTGQLGAAGGGPGGADAVGEGRRQQPPERGQRGAPLRVVQVVAHAVVLAVALHVARRPLQVGRTEAIDDRLARVDQRQARVHRVPRQSVSNPHSIIIIIIIIIQVQVHQAGPGPS